MLLNHIYGSLHLGFPGGLVVKNLSANVGDAGLIPGWGRFSREGNATHEQYVCSGNPMDKGAWGHKSQTQLSN